MCANISIPCYSDVTYAKLALCGEYVCLSFPHFVCSSPKTESVYEFLMKNFNIFFFIKCELHRMLKNVCGSWVDCKLDHSTICMAFMRNARCSHIAFGSIEMLRFSPCITNSWRNRINWNFDIFFTASAVRFLGFFYFSVRVECLNILATFPPR